MTDTDAKEETASEEQQDLVGQQQVLFGELSREQAEAEKALKNDQQQSEEEVDIHEESDE